MDFKLLLIQVITLLYRESQITNRTTNSAELASAIMALIKLPETAIDGDQGRDILIALRSTATWMISNPVSQEYDRTVLLQRIRVNVGCDDNLFYAVECAIEDVEDELEIKKMVLEYRIVLNRYLTHQRVEDILRGASTKATFSPTTIDWNSFVKDIIGELEPHASQHTVANNPAIVCSVDMDNDADLIALMEQAKDELSTEGILTTGWQAINRMCGEQNGLRRGEFVLIGALQHNFKTGFTLSLFRQMCIYNKPYLRDPTKKPLAIHISAENNLNDNVMQLYVSLMENEFKEAVSINGVDITTASAYVKRRLMETGYHVRMLRVDPSLFGYRDLQDLITQYEAEGYEIHFCVFDYLNMLNKKGCQSGPHGFETRDLFRRVRNFMTPRGITFVTPHQLSTQAKELVRNQIDNFVQEIANKGYYDSCRTIDQEVDLEFGIHIEKVNGESYLTIQRGKHRKISLTPEAHLYTVLPFNPIAGIPDDIHGVDSSMKKPGQRSSNGDNQNWWDSKQAA